MNDSWNNRISNSIYRSIWRSIRNNEGFSVNTEEKRGYEVIGIEMINASGAFLWLYIKGIEKKLWID